MDIKRAIDSLLYCHSVIAEQRFAGFDQNPKGVRDLLYSAIRAIQQEEENLSGASIWILTYEVNEYEQYGEYFCSAWNHKPTYADIESHIENDFKAVVKSPEPFNSVGDLICHILDGGGRVSSEDLWFHLKPITP